MFGWGTHVGTPGINWKPVLELPCFKRPGSNGENIYIYIYIWWSPPPPGDPRPGYKDWTKPVFCSILGTSESDEQEGGAV